MNAYLSSVRNDGQGAFDLYSVFFRRPLTEQNPQNPQKVTSAFAIMKANMKENELDVVNPINTNIPVLTNEPVTLQSVLYNSESGEWNPGTDKQIENACKLLVQYPNLKLIINAHSDDSQELYISLFLSVQQADLFATALAKKGIATDRILLRGCAGQFPLAKKYRFDGSLDENAPKLNNRVDFEIYGPTDSIANFENNKVGINPIMRDSSSELFNKEQIGLRYKVRFISTSTLYNNPIVKSDQFIVCEKSPMNPAINYLMGSSLKYETSRVILEKLQDARFENAKIIPYIDGFPIDKEKARELSSVYPDLQNYVESED
jgi:outer membrane protein OmpA-like peptidoglycan-associated protein